LTGLAGKKSTDKSRDEDGNNSIRKKSAVDITKWSERALDSYNRLHDVVLNNLPGIWPTLEFALSVKSILNIKGCNLPFAGVILGPPSSLKTATIQLFRGYRYSFYTDSFTSKALVSHNSGVDEKKLKQIDMLPKIKNKLFLTPELAPIFASRDEDLLQILGTLTRIADGQGYESDTGSQGHREYAENIMFAWIGAAVEVPYKVHRHLAVLGPRLYFFRLAREVHSEDEYLYYCMNVSDNFTERLDRIRYALYEYLAFFELHPAIEESEDDGIPPKIPFTGKSTEGTADRETIDRYLIKLAELLARLRAIVPTWYTRDTQGSDYGYSIAIVEEPNRAITQLRNLARGHALSQGRDYITIEDDIPLLIKVVLSTASIERSSIFDILIANDGVLSTSQICEYLNTTQPTALRTMTELKAVGLVDMYEGTGYHNREMKVSLKPEFNWFLTARFQELRAGVDCKEKYPPHRASGLHNLLYESSVINKIIRSDTSVLRGGENSLQSVTSDISGEGESIHRCPYCNYNTTSRFYYRCHLCDKHGMEWEYTK
jgi:hypothetical protein